MDIVDTALKFAPSGSPASYLFALIAGAATSVGPCVAPRYVAVAAISNGTRAGRLSRLGAFVAGTIAFSVAIASIGSLLIHIARFSPLVYWSLSFSLVVCGARGLWLGGGHACGRRDGSIPSTGGAFLLGAATSTTISPCCTPVLIAFGALGGASLTPERVVALMAAYLAGHIAPALLLYTSATAARAMTAVSRDAAATVAAAVTIALGLYYAVLA